jgi:hypothetical protein
MEVKPDLVEFGICTACKEAVQLHLISKERIMTQKVKYLDQEKEVRVLARWSSASALLDVMLGDVDTLFETVSM